MSSFVQRFFIFFLLFFSIDSLRFSSKSKVSLISSQKFKHYAKAQKSKDPEVIATGLVYFVQGSLTVSRLATSFFLKDELGLSPVEIATLTGITSVPWAMKPFYGLVSDNIPIFGSRRRSYLVLSSFLGIFSWIDLGLYANSPFHASAAIFLSSLSVAVSDVIIDSIVVEKTQQHSSDALTTERIQSASDLQTICWGASSAGALLSTLFGVNAMSVLKPREIFFLTSLLPLAVAISAIFIDEKPVALRTGNGQNVGSVIVLKMKEIFKFLQAPTILLPLFFLFLWRITPNAETAMFYFYSNELSFSESFISKLQFLTSFSSLLGILLYRNFISKRLQVPSVNTDETKKQGGIPITSLIQALLVTSIPFGLLQIILTSGLNQNFFHISNELFSEIDAVVISLFEEVSFMPIMTLATVLCPEGVEGAIFASIMSIFNLAGIFSNEISAVIMDKLEITDHNFQNLSLYVAICALSSILPLTFVKPLLDKLGRKNPE